MITLVKDNINKKDIDHLESLMKKDSPSALMLVSVLGLFPDMDKIVTLFKKYNVILLEGACESIRQEKESLVDSPLRQVNEK